MMVALCVYISLPKGHGCHGVIPYSAGNRVGTANAPENKYSRFDRVLPLRVNGFR